MPVHAWLPAIQTLRRSISDGRWCDWFGSRNSGRGPDQGRGRGGCCSDGVALVDDISRCWLRGRKEVEAYHLKTLAATKTVKSQLGDIQCQQHGETAWITAWLEQT